MTSTRYRFFALLIQPVIWCSGLFAQTTFSITLSAEKDKTIPTCCFQLSVLQNGKTFQPRTAISGKDTTIRLPLTASCLYELFLEHDNTVYNSIQLNTDSLTAGSLLQQTFTIKVKNLSEVIVTQKTPYYKGDTLVIPVDSIKTRPYSPASELLNKVPGVEVGLNGDVKVNGKKVDEITVNGQRLFGGNAKATLEAIKSDMVQQLEVVERENSSGEKVPSLNLKLQKSRSRGWYGDVTAMGANQQHYKTDLRLNYIKPKLYLNSFINQNNINERSLSEQSLYSFTNSFKKDIAAYSITEQQGQGNVSVTRSDDNLFESGATQYGITKVTSGGISLSKSGKNNSTDAFLLTEKFTRSQTQDYYGSLFLNPFTQKDSSSTYEQLNRYNLLANISHQVTAGSRNSLKFAQTIRFSGDETARNTSTRNILSTPENGVILKNLITSFTSPETKRLNLVTQGMWLHRFKKPACVFSAYTRYEFEKNSFDNTYTNTGLGFNNQEVNRWGNRHIAELQLVQSLPVNRELLFEMRVNNRYDTWSIEQAAYNYDSASSAYSSYLPMMSANPLSISNYRGQALANLLYKKTKSTFITGLGLYYWQSVRNLNTRQLALRSKPLVLPFVMYKRKLNSTQSLILQYRSGWDIPANDQLVPLPDSTNIQQVRTGNPMLDGAFRHAVSASFSSSGKSGHLFSFALQGIYIDDPVTASSITDSRGKISNTFAQYGSTKQVNLSLFWLNFNASKPFNAFASLFVSGNSSYALNNNVPFNFNSLFGIFYFGGRWKISKNTEADMKWQMNYNGYKDTRSSRGDLRNTLIITLENAFPNEWYTTVNANVQFNGVNSPDNRVNPFLRADVAKYFTKKNRCRLVAGLRNIFNVNKITTFAQTATLQAINQFNTLPRLFTLGFTWYFDKWTGKN